ncbi:hypothetical protein [Klebsiella michiganensis]|uniref:hypothetical protein n=1 Tax=Klebsiella michiganensis TaxID=1134687 RepID=UPI00292F8FCD|nr:hypothetical protein [Klebsiella michiganensis]
MTSKLTREQTQQIIDAADAVISALAGTNDEVHKDDTDKMIRLWDDLNDRYAPPEVVRELARIAQAAMDSEAKESISFDEWSRKCALQITLCYPDFREKAQYIWDSARETQQPAPVVPDRSIFEQWWESQNGAPLDGWDSLRTTDGYCDDGIDGQFEAWNACRAAMLQELQKSAGASNNCRSNEKVQVLQVVQVQSVPGINPAPALGSLPKTGEVLPANSPVIPDGSEDTKRLNWLDAQNKRLNEYYGTTYGWKFDANFQRNAMMLHDSNYPVMTVRQAIDEAIAAAPQEVKS